MGSSGLFSFCDRNAVKVVRFRVSTYDRKGAEVVVSFMEYEIEARSAFQKALDLIAIISVQKTFTDLQEFQFNVLRQDFLMAFEQWMKIEPEKATIFQEKMQALPMWELLEEQGLHLKPWLEKQIEQSNELGVNQ